jgi:predicted O-linked N-acetylglucosamine transferase (SPINDLY family)
MMIQSVLTHGSSSLRQQATEATDQKHYIQAVSCYEQLTQLEPDEVGHYWHLGLSHLLAGNEAEAQVTWMMAISAAELDQVELWSKDLVELLETAARQQESEENFQIAWVIRQHICEVKPDYLANLLHLLQLEVRLEKFQPEFLEEQRVIELLTSKSQQVGENLVLQTFEDVLGCEFGNTLVMKFAEACLEQVVDSAVIIDRLVPKAITLWREQIVGYNMLATYYLEVCLRYDPNHAQVLSYLSGCYFSGNRFLESIEIARQYVKLCKTLPERLEGNGVLIGRLLRTGTFWDESQSLFAEQNKLLSRLSSDYDVLPDIPLNYSILCSSCFVSYFFEDNPKTQRPLQNQVAELTQLGTQLKAKDYINQWSEKKFARRFTQNKEKLKVAYICRYFRQHSVGWLARWLFEHHSHDRFEVYTYHIHQKHLSSFTERWFLQNADRSASFDGTALGIAEHIHDNDQIDILIDLDSLTSDHTCEVMALKPAPVQATWLGLDASGLPAIDYFIADPYVLPDDAQDYYSEKIWRLPQTYIAVDGFEVGTPTLRRDHLGIPSDAVVYLTAQQGHKRHPAHMRLQLQIIREVPNSYLLVKGLAEEALLRELFEQTAIEEGVAIERLRFLPNDATESAHRANLQIADVVLDTFPYNGATTTLETLWMGIPIVTKVGQQFAARNSYGMMMNVGITEGIAWTDEEYLEWGIRLGSNLTLRQQVAWKLRQSRHSSPLWNAKQFTREMEKAYEQMWQIYRDGAVGS